MKKYGIGVLLCALGVLIGFGAGKVTDYSGESPKPQIQETETYPKKSWESKELEPIQSKLKDTKKCWLCGSDNRSLMGFFRKFDSLGIICVNNWYVLDMRIRNQDEGGNFTAATGGVRSGHTGTGEGGCSFSTDQMSDRGISTVKISYGEDRVFDVKKVQKHLCQGCLDKLLESMETYGYEGEEPRPNDLCLVDFQTLELYPLQEHNRSYFIRDYYVQVDAGEEEMKVQAIYAPELNYGKKPGENNHEHEK